MPERTLHTIPSVADIRVVLFDFGGVLAEEGFREGLAAIARASGLEPVSFQAGVQRIIHSTGYLTGKGSEAAFWQAVREKYGIAGSDRMLREEILSRFVLRDWMLAVVTTLDSHDIMTGILSDQTNWLEEIDGRHAFLNRFTHVFNSYSMGKSKDDPSHFDDVLSLLRKEASQVLFIDDNEGHCRRAALRGIRTIWFQERAEFFHDMKRLFPAVSFPG